ncbi:MAG: response regulator [Planctomycetota bacterium]
MAKILVVDDEQTIRKLIQDFLNKGGHTVVTAGDAETTMELLRREKFDILVLDIILPDTMGVDLLNAIHDLAPYMQVILITGAPTVETVSEAMRAGAFDYIAKPFSSEAILKSVANAARVKALSDDRRRLEKENRIYQENLELLVEERTHALRESEKLYRTLVENVDLGITFINTDYEIVMTNSYQANAFKRSVSDLVGMHCYEKFRKRDSVCPVCPGTRAMEKGVPAEEIIERKNYQGKVVTLCLRAFPVFDSNGNASGFIEVAEDITERTKADELIKASLNEKEILLRELHHRTKNNMQVISALISLQSGKIEDENTLKTFREIDNRIKSMALVHQRLYQSESFHKLNLSPYIHDLARSLMASYNVRPDRVTMKLDIDDIEVSIDVAISCGLIINEAVSNALEHAFVGEKPGEIVVALKKAWNERISLSIRDNGIGFDRSYDFHKPTSLGMQLLMNLAKQQLNADFNVISNKGTEVYVEFAR